MTRRLDVSIRAARPSDRERLVEQFLALNLYEEPFAGNRRLDRAGAEDGLAKAEVRVRETGGAALVAEVAGDVVGHLFLTFESLGPYVREDLRGYAYVSELFVREAFRSRGVGTALLTAAEDLARRRDAGRMMIGVLSGNDLAERMYRHFGFRDYARELVKDLAAG